MKKMYEIRLNENQLRIVQISLEEFFRIRLLQFFDLSNDLANIGYEYKKDDTAGFNDFIKRRDLIRQKLEEIGSIIRTSNPIIERSEDEMNASDIWAVIRHFRYIENGGDPNNFLDVRADKPIILGTEFPPKISAVKEASDGK